MTEQEPQNNPLLSTDRNCRCYNKTQDEAWLDPTEQHELGHSVQKSTTERSYACPTPTVLQACCLFFFFPSIILCLFFVFFFKKKKPRSICSYQLNLWYMSTSVPPLMGVSNQKFKPKHRRLGDTFGWYWLFWVHNRC